MSFFRSDELHFEQLMAEVLSVPEPPSEWLPTFAAGLEVDYIGRNKSRTVLQAMVTVPQAELSSTGLLIPPEEGEIQVGHVRFTTRTVGDFDRVIFSLNDRPIFTKTRPPFSVELDMGSPTATRPRTWCSSTLPVVWKRSRSSTSSFLPASSTARGAR